MHYIDIKDYLVIELLKLEREISMSKKLCLHPYCPNFAEPGSAYCAKHKKQKDDRSTYKHHYLYSLPSWRKLRRKFLNDNPVCAVCGAKATVVDHIQPHHGNMDLFYAVDNLQPLCQSCHNAKTAKERA